MTFQKIRNLFMEENKVHFNGEINIDACAFFGAYSLFWPLGVAISFQKMCTVKIEAIGLSNFSP